MSDPFKQDVDVQSVFVDNEACIRSDGENPLPQSSSEAGAEEDDIHYLREGNSFFDIILAKSHLPPQNNLYMPVSMVRRLPRATVPVVLRHGGKNWNLSYGGDHKAPKFDTTWKRFVTENHLKLGDACVFELTENSNTILRFDVYILRPDDMPTELVELIESFGQTAKSPICID